MSIENDLGYLTGVVEGIDKKQDDIFDRLGILEENQRSILTTHKVMKATGTALLAILAFVVTDLPKIMKGFIL